MVDLLISYKLNSLVEDRCTAHINLIIGHFDTDINVFTNLITEDIIDRNDKGYNNFLKQYKEGNIMRPFRLK